MKKLLFALCFILLHLMLSAQDGVNFRQLGFDEALKAAKAEKKLVFMDCYASWCGPCKMMLKEIFPQKAAGDFFNDKFVSVKFDMEKGEGKDLKKKFQVKAYPTFIIIRPDGSELSRLVGGGTLEDFLSRVERCLDEKKSLAYLGERYEKKGRLNNRQMMDYYTALLEVDRNKEAREIHDKLAGQLKNKERFDPYFWSFFASSEIGDKEFDFVLDNTEKLKKNIGKDKVENFLAGKFFSAIYGSIFRGLPKNADVIKASLEKFDSDKKAGLELDYSLAEAVSAKDLDKAIELIGTNSGKLQAGDPIALMSLQMLQDKASKAQFSRMAGLVDKMLAIHKDDAGSCRVLNAWKENFTRLSQTGTVFVDASLEEAVNLSRFLQKRIFVDCYTSWCGPCKYMLNNVFPQEKVGDYMNRQFIPIKFDMESEAGKAIKDKFGVRAYPTFLIINPDGSLYHKIVGGAEPDEFISLLDVKPTRTSVALENRYKGGERSKDFMVLYVKSLQSTYSPDVQAVAGELYSSLKDEEKTSPEYWFLFAERGLLPEGSGHMEFLKANKKVFCEKIGTEKVERLLSEKYMKVIRSIYYTPSFNAASIYKKLKPEVARMEKEIQGEDLECRKELLSHVNICKAFVSGSFARLLATCEKEVKNIKADDFPFFNVITFDLTGKKTAAQKKRLAALGRYLIGHVQNENLKAKLENTVNSL